MCHKGTVRVPVLGAALLLAAIAAFAQSEPDWRRVGTSSVELLLASPATGPVNWVWYAPDGSLMAGTASGRLYRTTNFEDWTPVPGGFSPPEPPGSRAVRLPEASARVYAAPLNPTRIYALGRQLYRSDDQGHSWTNLTAFKSQSVVGGGQHSVAVSPANPDELVVANDFGVWRSMDGGLSWAGLNQSLPNLSVRRIVSTPQGARGTRIYVDGMGVLELAPGAFVWQPSASPLLLEEASLMRQYQRSIPGEISALAKAGETVYVGSADGRLWISQDNGRTFRATTVPSNVSGRVERIAIDPTSHGVALAALSGEGAHVLRTTNAGTFWDALDSTALTAPAYSIAADWAAGAVYVAAQNGVFYGHADLRNASTNPVAWQRVTNLPNVPATDVQLNQAGTQLYVALDGYGVWAAMAPHRASNLQIINAADFSTRAAAPGSLLSVVGARVSAARGGALTYPVLANSTGDSQIQVPFEAVGPSVALSLQTATGNVVRDLAVQPVSPAILLLSRDGVPAVYDADTGLPLDGKNAAHSNGRIQIMATGLGRVSPEWRAGMPAPLTGEIPSVVASVKAFLDGVPLEVSKATLAPGCVGFYVIEVQLPAITNAGTSELRISADGQDSNRVQIVIEP